MTRRKSAKSSSTKPLKELNQGTNVLQSYKCGASNGDKDGPDHFSELRIEGIERLKSILDDDSINNPQPGTSSAKTATKVENFASNAAALYDELDSFRLRWKRELEVVKSHDDEPHATNLKYLSKHEDSQSESELKENDNHLEQSCSANHCDATLRESFAVTNDLQNNSKQIYALAKKLFLIGVDMEQDEMHHESIRYYKQAVHLCPDIEKQIFREQCEASARANIKQQTSCQNTLKPINTSGGDDQHEEKPQEVTPLLDRVRESYCDDSVNNYCFCRPTSKVKPGQTHISQLPLEIILLILRHIIGQELDLASLESLGMVCRGLFLLSRDQSLWKSVCMSVWGEEITLLANNLNEASDDKPCKTMNWRQVYIENPRVNYDGVYISRTRYIRQGDVGFQDITYRPFHVIRYYRYLRFFPNKRVLILTTNEEPERIVPIFRHALRAKQFSSELSILEGTFEFSNSNQVTIVADKDCRNIIPVQAQNQTNRRQAQFMWSRQTPLAQKFNLKFELKTLESRPYRNNVLKWLDYTILTRLETGQEVTTFDLNPDTFPNLVFSRVRRFNLRSAEPLAGN